LAKRSNPFSQDRKGRQFELCSPRNPTGAGDKGGATSVRTPLAVHAHSATSRSIREGQHQPWDGRKSPHGGILAGKSHASVSWLWRPLITILWERFRSVSQIGSVRTGNYLAVGNFRTGPKPIWQSGLIRSHKGIKLLIVIQAIIIIE